MVGILIIIIMLAYGGYSMDKYFKREFQEIKENQNKIIKLLEKDKN